MRGVLLALAVSLSAACSHEPKVAFGEPCDADEVCETGLCVGDGTRSDRGRCNQSCGPETACPEGWSCSALTGRGVAVCAEGSGIPDLQLNSPRR